MYYAYKFENDNSLYDYPLWNHYRSYKYNRDNIIVLLNKTELIW